MTKRNAHRRVRLGVASAVGVAALVMPLAMTPAHAVPTPGQPLSASETAQVETGAEQLGFTQAQAAEIAGNSTENQAVPTGTDEADSVTQSTTMSSNALLAGTCGSAYWDDTAKATVSVKDVFDITLFKTTESVEYCTNKAQTQILGVFKPSVTPSTTATGRAAGWSYTGVISSASDNGWYQWANTSHVHNGYFVYRTYKWSSCVFKFGCGGGDDITMHVHLHADNTSFWSATE
jgi:hypothetical protein